MTKNNEIATRVAALRALLKQKNLHGYIVPRSDEYLGEYVPPSAERLAWLTGFTGSAGSAVVLETEALVMSDGRYTLQLKQQTDAQIFQTMLITETTLAGWIAEHAAPGARIGYDPRVMTGQAVQAMAATLAEKDMILEAVEGNLVDAVWADRSAPPSTVVEAFSEAVAGRSASAKRLEAIANIGEARKRKSWGGFILNAPESIAWLLNIRAGDVPHTPFALSTLLLREDGDIDWFIDKARLPASVAAGLGNHVRIVDPLDMTATLDALAVRAAQTKTPLLLDDAATPVWFRQRLEKAGASVEHLADPTVTPRACKTPEEQAGIRAAHLRDGVAMVKFLKWIDDEVHKGATTEQDVVDRLAAFRSASQDLRDTSFDTIAGWAGNGAIVHYHVTPESNKKIVPPGLLLVDSGGQYNDGTTDITRTVAVGAPTDEMKRHNTLVLKGHIAVASAVFPKGTQGRHIDVLARKALWDEGLDYAHGTGHGVGCYLSVHEGGVGISTRAENEFRPGMLVSNEPGYYREGAYGIRIENLILVREDGAMDDGRPRYRFETVTLAPFDRRLFDLSLLDHRETAWIDSYHARVFKTLAPLLDGEEQAWLMAACAPVAESAGVVPDTGNGPAPSAPV